MDETPEDKKRPPDEFTLFFADKLRPVVGDVGDRRRSAMKWAFLISLGVFAAFFVLIYGFFSPYHRMLDQYEISFWPIMFLLPATMAVITFSLVYILSLKNLVTTFRTALLDRMAEYMGPGISHVPETSGLAQEAEKSLLFGDRAVKPVENGYFRAETETIEATFSEIRVAPYGGATRERQGIFFVARFRHPFPAFKAALPEADGEGRSRLADKLRETGIAPDPDLRWNEDADLGVQMTTLARDQEPAELDLPADARALLHDLRLRRSTDLFLAMRGNALWMALLSPREDGEAGVFETFDFAKCREFCREAAVCLAVARDAEGKTTGGPA